MEAVDRGVAQHPMKHQYHYGILVLHLTIRPPTPGGWHKATAGRVAHFLNGAISLLLFVKVQQLNSEEWNRTNRFFYSIRYDSYLNSRSKDWNQS